MPNAEAIAFFLDTSERNVEQAVEAENEPDNVVHRTLAARDLDLQYLDVQKNDRYLDNMFREETRRDAAGSSIWEALEKLELLDEGVKKCAHERNALKRSAYALEIGQYSPDQLVFIDEFYFDKRSTGRLTGLAKGTERGSAAVPFKRGRRFAILAALALDGIIDLNIVEDTVSPDYFLSFVRDCLLMEMNPWPQKNSVLVVANSRFQHDDRRLRHALTAKGMDLVYLPPHSPDYNPCEPAFASTKGWIRRNPTNIRKALESKDPDEVTRHLTHALFSACTRENAGEWFQDCGYF